MSERQLKAWQDAGLIDAYTADRIRVWDAEHRRPWGLVAIIGLGALTIGLGILSFVAANWDAIPGEIRLAVHFALIAGLAAWLWRYLPDAGHKNDYFNDGLLFVIVVLGLTFFGHIGQVYQSSSPLWQPLLAWLVIFSPLLLLFGRGWPVATLWLAGVFGTAWSHAGEYGGAWLWHDSERQALSSTLYWGFIACPPMVVAALAAFMRGRTDRPSFWRLLEQLAIGTIIVGLGSLILISGWESHSHIMLGSIVIHGAALIGAAGVIYAVQRTRSGQATAAILCVAALLHIVQGIVSNLHDLGPWISTLLFFLLWGAVAGGALFAGWRRIFQGAIALLALRMVILSFELNDDLLGSGVSLILLGAFAMAMAWVTVRISRRYAPAGTIEP